MAEKPKLGRPPVPDAERLKERTVRLNDAHYQMYKQLGRDRWLRAKLDEEKVK